MYSLTIWITIRVRNGRIDRRIIRASLVQSRAFFLTNSPHIPLPRKYCLPRVTASGTTSTDDMMVRDGTRVRCSRLDFVDPKDLWKNKWREGYVRRYVVTCIRRFHLGIRILCFSKSPPPLCLSYARLQKRKKGEEEI